MYSYISKRRIYLKKRIFAKETYMFKKRGVNMDEVEVAWEADAAALGYDTYVIVCQKKRTYLPKRHTYLKRDV